MLSDVEKGNNLMSLRLTTVAIVLIAFWLDKEVVCCGHIIPGADPARKF